MKRLISSYLILLTIFIASMLMVLSSSIQAVGQIKTKNYSKELVQEEYSIFKLKRKEKELQLNLKEFEASNNMIKKEWNEVYGKVQTVDIDFLKDAEHNIGDKSFVLKIYSKEAKSIAVNFDEFYLPEGVYLSFYGKNQITDSINYESTGSTGKFSTIAYNGNFLLIKLSYSGISAGIKIHIKDIELGVKPLIENYYGSPGASASCQVNAICNTLSNNLRNSVALIKGSNSSETNYWTGSLMNSTCNTRRGLILTANHGIEAFPNNWVFQFFYFSTQCNSNTGYIESVQYNASKILAKYVSGDIALLEITQGLNDNHNLYFNGWMKNPPTNFTSFVLHHPRADVLKISVDNHPTQGGTLPNTWYNYFETGGSVEPVSSGSPLYVTQYGLVTGVVRGVYSGAGSPCNDRQALSSAFAAAWEGNGTPQTRLRDHLDPFNSSGNSYHGEYMFLKNPSIYQTLINGSSMMCSSNNKETYTISNYPPGSTISWQIIGDNASIPNPSSGTSVEVTKTNLYATNSVRLRLTIGSCEGTITKDKEIHLANTATITQGPKYCSGIYSEFTLSATPAAFSNPLWTVDYLGTNSSIYIDQPVSLGTWVSVKGGGVVRFSYTACGVNKSNTTTVYSNCAGALLNSEVTVSPNPTTNLLTIDLSKFGISENIVNGKMKSVEKKEKTKTLFIEVVEIGSGKIVMQTAAPNTPIIHLDVSRLKSSTYNLVIKNSQEIIYNHSFIKL